MIDHEFLNMLVERAENVVALQKRGRRRKAAAERSAIYRDIDFYCRNNTAAIAMFEKLMIYHLDERPSLEQPRQRRNTKVQRRKKRDCAMGSA